MVGTFAAVDYIVTFAAVNGIVTSGTVQIVVAGRTGDAIVFIATDHIIAAFMVPTALKVIGNPYCVSIVHTERPLFLLMVMAFRFAETIRIRMV